MQLTSHSKVCLSTKLFERTLSSVEPKITSPCVKDAVGVLHEAGVIAGHIQIELLKEI